MQKDKKLWCVYKLTSPSNKVYIGITKDIKHRWRNNGAGYKGSTRIHNAIQKYGWECFTHEVIYSNLSLEEACEIEVSLIKRFKSTDIKYGYNLQSGGRVFLTNEETRQKISKALVGHAVSAEVRERFRNARSVPIICIENKTTYKNCKEAAEQLNLCATSIGKAANGKQENCGGYHFAKLSDFIKNNVPKFTPRPAKYNQVRCITTGQIFENISQASKETGISRRAISYACNGTHKTSGKMRWEFVKEGS